jgi:hypothetical protein
MASALERHLLDTLERVAGDPARPPSPPHLRDHVVERLVPVIEHHGGLDVGFTVRVSPRGSRWRRGRVEVRFGTHHVTVPVG